MIIVKKEYPKIVTIDRSTGKKATQRTYSWNRKNVLVQVARYYFLFIPIYTSIKI